MEKVTSLPAIALPVRTAVRSLVRSDSQLPTRQNQQIRPLGQEEASKGSLGRERLLLKMACVELLAAEAGEMPSPFEADNLPARRKTVELTDYEYRVYPYKPKAPFAFNYGHFEVREDQLGSSIDVLA